MPSGGTVLSIDLSSSAIAATVSRQGLRIPILIDGRLVMPPGVVIGPAGEIYVGLDTMAAMSLPVDHRFVDNPTDLLGRPINTADATQPDPVELLATVLRHITHHAAVHVNGPITALTVTVPPSWGPRRCGHVSEAATRAGFPPPALVTAPAALAAYATILGVTAPEGACVLVCQADREPATLTVLQTAADGYRELATQQIILAHGLDHLIAHTRPDGHRRLRPAPSSDDAHPITTKQTADAPSLNPSGRQGSARDPRPRADPAARAPPTGRHHP